MCIYIYIIYVVEDDYLVGFWLMVVIIDYLIFIYIYEKIYIYIYYFVCVGVFVYFFLNNLIIILCFRIFIIKFFYFKNCFKFINYVFIWRV